MAPVTTDTIKEHVRKIKEAAVKLDESLAKGEQIGYLAGLSIAQKAISLTSLLKAGTKDILLVPLPISEAAANEILDLVKELETPTLAALEKAFNLQKHFASLKIAGIVSMNLKSLYAAVTEFEQSLVERTPTDDTRARGVLIKDTIDADFVKCLAAYGS